MEQQHLIRNNNREGITTENRLEQINDNDHNYLCFISKVEAIREVELIFGFAFEIQVKF